MSDTRTSAAWILAAVLLPLIASGQGAADADADGIADTYDECPGSPPGAGIDSRGCALDLDFDGVPDGVDQCPSTAVGADVDARGCTLEQVLQSRLPPQPIVPRARMETREPERMAASPGAPEPEPLSTPAGDLHPLVPVRLEAPAPTPSPESPPTLAAAPVTPAPVPAAAPTPAAAPAPVPPPAAPTVAAPAPAPAAVTAPPAIAAKPVTKPERPLPAQVAIPPLLPATASVAAPSAVPAGPPTILFDPGVTDLSVAALAQLDALLPELKARLAADARATLSVLGYADPRTEPRSGEKLADTRAALVRSYLIARGLDRTRVRAAARGFSTAQAGGAKANRRVELRFED
ncbi:MAG TPA: OmpA family protein [Solimonas sp.]|nr:OmpA family protein [Solimonas sp.]